MMSDEQLQAARKWFHYCEKFEKAKSTGIKAMLYRKMEEYRKLTFELAEKERSETS